MFLLIPVFAAAVFPPTITKSFSPPIVGVNETSTMTITITNPNTSDLTGATMTDTFPPGLVGTGTGSSPCGTVTVTPPPSSLHFSGTIPANSTCTITALAFSTTPGSYQNLSGNVFSSGPSSLQQGVATLTVLANIPALPRWSLVALAMTLAALGWITSSSRTS